MSHELRTPMHAILSFSKLGLDKMASGKAMPDKIEGYLSRIDQSGRRLLGLLNDLLDLAKLESGKMNYEFMQADLGTVINGVLLEMEMVFSKAGLVVEQDYRTKDLTAWCDPMRMGQVMRNLLSNALKFTPAGKKIRIRITEHALPAGRRSDDTGVVNALAVQVIDQGIGIPSGELDEIFDKFVQSSKTKSGAGGTGLGLAITKEIISQHGGTIRAENSPEGGAVLTFTLRRDPMPSLEDAVSTRPGESDRSVHAPSASMIH
ncbi:MAG: HAMP domain-containing histidine kinase [Betaproteobacteria bacterium]|nr:HAMP domain-containing histidine kinase [Betaproteobacteria bacterium]